MLGTFHLANKAGDLGIFLQAGGQRDPATGSWTYAGGLNLAGTVTKGDNNQIQIYPNLIYNAAGNGQVSNTNVTTFNSATALLGVTDTPVLRDDKGQVQRDEKGNPVAGPNTFGAEASVGGNIGTAATPGGGTKVSGTATALIFYQRAFGNRVLGAALGGSYETGGGGWGVFFRIGVGADWQPGKSLELPSLVLPTP